MRSFVILLRDACPNHVADIAISGECRRQDAPKALSIEAVGLHPTCASGYENARWLNDAIDDAIVGQ